MTNLVWFTNDLFVKHNLSLYNAIKGDNGVVACFFITPSQWEEHKYGELKQAFILKCVQNLKSELDKKNIPLIIQSIDYFAEIPDALVEICKQININKVYFSTEYIYNEKKLKQEVKDALIDNQISYQEELGNFLSDPNKVLKQDKQPYSVYTPYKNKAKELINLRLSEYQGFNIKTQEKCPNVSSVFSVNLNDYIDRYNHLSDKLSKWVLSEDAILAKMRNFVDDSAAKYKDDRDFPYLDATSTLSPYLAVGALSVWQCILYAVTANGGSLTVKNGITTWIDELIWRDFYHYICHHNENVCKGKNFNPKYNKINWSKNSNHLEAWKSARVGIPIVDAAINQLVETGWMHNRLRMIVAMFLTKNLLQNWRYGEDFFCKHLIDLDFASNNGGWQWSASTGTDAAPYFRIFNPVTQSIKFDPDGRFIRKYLPQLSGLSASEIHEPYKYYSEQELQDMNYCGPIVDLKKSRAEAIEEFSKA